MNVNSMTGFAVDEAEDGGFRWRWEARSVNGRGLDLRLRLPDGAETLEAECRRLAGLRLRRGSVTLALRVTAAPESGSIMDGAALSAVVAAAAEARRVALAAGLDVAPVAPDRLIAFRGVMAAEPVASTPPTASLATSLERALDALAAARATEGSALRAVLEGLLTEIATLVDEADEARHAQIDEARERLERKVAELAAAAPEVAPDRIAAELALLAVRQDVSEEIDRLRVHVTAARRLLSQGGPIGRELDFLTQEFNREANTLCSKAASQRLTDIGLALKVRIDRMREQVQNIE
ncbi:MAG: YicC/YloC family endoribonuclease [Rubrimonas sp.]